MANVNEMIESKYLKQTDVAADTVVTIAKVGKANVARKDDEPEYKWLVRFNEFQKPMVLNSTNIKRIARACNSNETEEWVGKKVVLYVDPDVEFGGNVVGGLRIRSKTGAGNGDATDPLAKANAAAQAASKKGHFDDMEDDIPF